MSQGHCDASAKLTKRRASRGKRNNAGHARRQCQTHRAIGGLGVDWSGFATGVLAMTGNGGVRHHVVFLLDNRTAKGASQRACHDRKDHKQGHPPGLPAQFAHMQHRGGRRYKVKRRRFTPYRF